MGNRASLSIHLDKNFHQAGKPLTGKVVLVVDKSIKSNGSLELRVIGTERAQRRMKRPLCRIDLTLHKFEGKKMSPGVFSFPFTINLPASLPSSAKYPNSIRDSSGTGFRIEYKLIAGIHRGLRESCPLFVSSAPLPAEPVQYMFQPASHAVKAVGMIDKGTISVGASILNSQVGRGEKLNLHLACRNDSTASIQRVDIKLFEEMEWGNGQKAVETRLHLGDVSLPGLDKMPCSRQDLRSSRADPTSQSACYQEIFRDLTSGLNHVPLDIPSSTRDSYTGQIVNISHFLEIKFKTKKIVTSPMIRIPIRVGTAPDRSAVPDRPAPTSSQQHASAPATTSSSSKAQTEPEIHVPSMDVVDSIPVAQAMILPSGTVQAPMAIADPAVMVLGGNAITRDGSDDSIEELADLEPLAPPKHLANVSLEGLLFEMAKSINDYDILSSRLEDAGWRGLFASLTPDQFSSVLLRVSDEFDQPRVAGLLAPYLNHNHFTCEYAAAAVRSAASWNRSCVAQKLLPMCVDVATGYELIRNELSEWDRTVTESDFQAAIARKKSPTIHYA